MPHSASSALAWLLSSAASSSTSLRRRDLQQAEHILPSAEKGRRWELGAGSTRCQVPGGHPRLSASSGAAGLDLPAAAFPLPATPVKAAGVALVRGVEAVGRSQQHVQRSIGSGVLSRQRGPQRGASPRGRPRLLGQRAAAHQPDAEGTGTGRRRAKADARCGPQYMCC